MRFWWRVKGALVACLVYSLAALVWLLGMVAVGAAIAAGAHLYSLFT